MADLTISEFTVSPNVQLGDDTSCYLKMWYLLPFTNSDGQDMQWSISQPGNWFYQFTCTIDGDGIIHVPPLTITTTTDGNPRTSVMSARFFSLDGRPLNWLFQSKGIPANLAPATSWLVFQDSFQYIQPINPQPFMVTNQQMVDYVDSRISGAGAPKMTSVLFGIGRLDFPAADPTDPIVANAENPIITGTAGIKSLAQFSSLANAVSSIGSTVTTLLIPTAVTTNSVTIPSTLTLRFEILGKLTVNTGQTVTINSKPALDPGKQVFFGDGTIVFGTGAAVDGVDLGWWAVSNDNSTRVAHAINQALTSLENTSGGQLTAPIGTWDTDGDHTVTNGVTIAGQGHSYDISPSVTTIRLQSDNAAIFKCLSDFRNISFKRLRLNTDSGTGQTGILAEGAAADGAALGLVVEDVVFNNFTVGMNVHSLSGAWQVEDIFLTRPQFFNCEESFKCNTINTSITWLMGEMSVPSGGVGLQVDGLGNLNMIGTLFGGTGTGISIDGLHSGFNLIGIENEGNDFLLVNNLSDGNVCINIYGGVVQSPIKMAAGTPVNMVGVEFTGANLFVIDSGIQVAYTAINCPGFDTALDDNSGGTAIRLYSTGPTSYNQMNRQLTVIDNALAATVPILRSGSTTMDKVLMRLGQTNASDTFLNYFDWIRREPDGWLLAKASEATAGFAFNRPIEQAEVVTLPTSGAGKFIFGANTAHFIQASINGGAPKNVIFTQTNLTANKVPKADSVGTITDSSITDNGSTVSTTLPVSLASTLNVVGNFSVNTNKFNVTALTGDTAIAGALAVTGASTVAALTGTTLTGSSSVISPSFAQSAAFGSGTLVEALLATVGTVDMNTATATTLFTCPSGKSCIITKVIVDNVSTSLTTASWSYGWTSAAFADVIANATHTELTAATLYTILIAKVGATIGTSTGTFKTLNNTLQGGAATARMRIFGIIF